MPNIFKSLALIAAWALSVSTMIRFVVSEVDSFTNFGEEAYPFAVISWNAWKVYKYVGELLSRLFHHRLAAGASGRICSAVVWLP